MPLHIQLLPTSAGDQTQHQPLTTFLINDMVAVDAGSLGFALSGDALARVRNILITHSHLDHIASLPMAVAEVYPRLTSPIRVHGSDVVLKALRDHLFNGVVWPDFTKIPLLNGAGPSLELCEIRPHRKLTLEGIDFTPVPVNHEVPTLGIIAQVPGAAVAFTSDTTRTDEIWALASRCADLKAVFVDCSFPDELEELAVQSGHLTPRMVAEESRKLTRPAQVLCVHIKPESRGKVLEQLQSHKSCRISAVELGRTYTF